MATYDVTPELVADFRCETTEGPLWHEEERALFWLDIPAGRLFRHDPATGQSAQVYAADGQIGGFTVQADGTLLLFGERGRVWTWNPRDGATQTVIAGIAGEEGSRFNDVIADPAGRVFAGTMPDGERPGRLYRLDPNGDLTMVLADVGISNGMGFTPDMNALYHTNSTTRTIVRYPYEQTTGAIGNGDLVVQVPEGQGVPDGLAIDAHGDLWSARWDGAALFHYSPQGELLGSIAFPARKVSSVTFAGPAWEDVFVTLAGGLDKAQEGKGAGAVYSARLGVRGRPPFRSRIGLAS